MRTLYLDLQMGAAGDMLSAALYELLTDEQKKEYLIKINDLGIDGVTVSAEPSEKCGIRGTHMSVQVDGAEEGEEDSAEESSEQGAEEGEEDSAEESSEQGAEEGEEDSAEESSEQGAEEGAEEHGHLHDHEAAMHVHQSEAEYGGHDEHGCDGRDHDHDGHDHCGQNYKEHHSHSHAHHHATMPQIHEQISGMKIPDAVREDALEVYADLAGAESHVHGKDVSEIHFHEVGEKDAVVDIVSVCLLMHMLAPDKVISSTVAAGSGMVHCAHGILPVPAPATAYLLKDRKIPWHFGPEEGELLTPTGAALTGHFADAFGEMPDMVVSGIGYGMGKKDFLHANCVRAMIGESKKESKEASKKERKEGKDSSAGDRFRDQVLELSCNLDDMTPEDIAYAGEQIFAAGALDVFTTPIGMKKNRPAVMLTALCHEERKENVVSAFFAYTTTLGVREKTCNRFIMKSEKKEVSLGNSSVTVKFSHGYGQIRVKPEYDDAAEAARREGVSAAEIRRRIMEKLS